MTDTRGSAMLGKQFTLVHYDYTQVRCEWGDRHTVKQVHEVLTVTVTDTKLATGSYGGSYVMPDGGLAATAPDGRVFVCNWNGIYDELSTCGIHNIWTRLDDPKEDAWWLLRGGTHPEYLSNGAPCTADQLAELAASRNTEPTST